MSFSNWVRVIRSAFRDPFPLFFRITFPSCGEVGSDASYMALADFTAGCCLPFNVQLKSSVPDSFSAKRPIAINEKAVDCVLNHVSCARLCETILACSMASRWRFISNKVSSIIASSRSDEPYT